MSYQAQGFMTPVTRTRKILAKTNFQSTKNELADLVDQRASQDDVQTKLIELRECMEEYLLATEDLEKYFQSYDEVDKIARLRAEMESVEKEFVKMDQQAREYLLSYTERRRPTGTPLQRSLADELRREIGTQREEIELLASELE